LNEKVKEASVLTNALLTSLMSEYLDLLSVELENLRLRDSKRGGLFIFELDVSKASCLTVWIELKLA